MAEVSAKSATDDLAHAEEAMERLAVSADKPVENGSKCDEIPGTGPSSPVPEPNTSDANVANGAAEHLVDHALRDALSRYKHRGAVLRLEAEVEDFVLNSTESQRLFSGDMSSYDRLLVHRTAQHWGLDTSTLNQGPEQGSIVAMRTPRTGRPLLRLTDLEVTMEEASVAAPVAGAGAAPGPAPKVLVRRRGDRPPRSPGGMAHGHHGQHAQHGGGGGGGGRGGPTIEDRELHYERARARIFGDAARGGAMPYPMMPGMMPMPPYAHPGMVAPPPPQQAQQQGGPGPQQHQQHGSQQQQHHQQQQQQHQQQNGGGATRPGAAGSSGRGSKAQLRNRQEDLSDPDFRRGRHGAAGGPRFDPGYGEDPSGTGGLYLRPTYGSEFPELAGGGPHAYYAHPQHPHHASVASPRAGGANAPGPAAPGMPAYPGYPMMAPMGHPYAYGPQGMMAAGPGGAMAQQMYAAAAAAAAQQQQQQGGGGQGQHNQGQGHPPHAMQYAPHPGAAAYGVAMTPYGYMPVRAGEGGAFYPAGGMVSMYPAYPGAPGMYAHPGSPPMGGAGGMAMLATSPTSGGGGGVVSPRAGWQGQQGQARQQGGQQGGQHAPQQQMQQAGKGSSRGSRGKGGGGGGGSGETPRSNGHGPAADQQAPAPAASDKQQQQ